MARFLFSTDRIHHRDQSWQMDGFDQDCPDCHDDDFWCGSPNCISNPRPLNAEEQAELAKESEPIDLRAILWDARPRPGDPEPQDTPACRRTRLVVDALFEEARTSKIMAISSGEDASTSDFPENALALEFKSGRLTIIESDELAELRRKAAHYHEQRVEADERIVELEDLARDLYITCEERTDFGHFRHAECTPETCDHTFREQTLDRARSAGVLP